MSEDEDADTAPSRTVDLPRGYVDDEGTHHRQATLRIPTLADEIGAEEEVREEGYTRENTAAFHAAFVARCLVSLGEIPEVTMTHLMRLRRGEVAALRTRLNELESYDLDQAQQEAGGNEPTTDEAS